MNLITIGKLLHTITGHNWGNTNTARYIFIYELYSDLYELYSNLYIELCSYVVKISTYSDHTKKTKVKDDTKNPVYHEVSSLSHESRDN